VVSRTRHSPLRESGDYARLGHALTELGEPAKAVSLLEEARGVFKDDPNNLRLAAAEAVAQHLAGNPEKSAQALARAAQNDAASQSEELVLVLARAHLVTGRQDSAQAMLKYLVQSHPEAKELHGRISTLLRDGGAPELAEQLVGQSIREIVLLNNEAVRRAQAGELGPAAQMLSEAARRLPGNLQIVANAAAALFYDIFQNGLEEEKLRTAQAFVQAVQTGNPAHPKLVDLAEMMSRIRTKFGLSSKP
jgi:tetratricopeptide (TPR) repeat protein